MLQESRSFFISVQGCAQRRVHASDARPAAAAPRTLPELAVHSGKLTLNLKLPLYAGQ